MSRVRGAGVLFLAAVLLVACGAPRSIHLALSFHAGMTRTMRLRTEVIVPGGTGQPTLRKIDETLVYRFRVERIEAAGVAKVSYSLLRYSVSGDVAPVKAYLAQLARRPQVFLLNADGAVVGQVSGGANARSLAAGALPALPQVMHLPSSKAMTTGFGGLTGKRVSVGETWSEPMPGQSGTNEWTLESVSRTEARLGFQGTGWNNHLTLPDLPADVKATSRVRMSGFVVLERATGWPVRGESVERMRVTIEGSGGSPIAMRLVIRFDPAQ